MNPESPSSPPYANGVGAMPTIYPDELLYSIVARYGMMTGYTDAAPANLDLFGRAFGHAATALPSNLNAMAMRLPVGSGMTGRVLALKHTLLPYHCAFLPEAEAEQAVDQARVDGGYDNRPTRTPEKPLRTPDHLRFCPECLRNMAEQGEDPHWKRVHQLAIVVICPEHGCDLRRSGIVPHVSDKRLHPCSADVCYPGAPSVIPAGAAVDREMLLQFATSARTLLEGGYPPGMDRGSGPEHAQTLRDLGYYRSSRLDWSKLLPEMQTAIAGIAPALPGIESIGRGAMGWFALTLSPVRSRHADRVLITAAVTNRIKALEPRFWTASDRATGQRLMSLDTAT